MPRFNKDAHYEVGYKKPPKHSQFKKGKSGNENGRPKKPKDAASQLLAIFDEKIVVKDSRGKTKKMSKFEALIQNTLASSIKGDPRARKAIIDIAKMIGFFIGPPNPEVEQHNGVIVVPATLSVEEWIEKYAKPAPDSAVDPFDEEEKT